MARKKAVRIVIIIVLAPLIMWVVLPFFTDKEVSESAPENARTITTTETPNNENPESENFQAIDSSERAGAFRGRNNYSGSGTARLIEDGDGTRYLRFDDDFEASNGPDLRVYVGTEQDRGLELGALKGNIGAQNYELPANLDLSSIDTVTIFCRSFNVSFAVANL